MFDQYDAQFSNSLRDDARYTAVCRLVQGLIGYDGRPPRSIDDVLTISPYGRASQQMNMASRQIVAMLKEMLRCEVNRDPKNEAKFQSYAQKLHRYS